MRYLLFLLIFIILSGCGQENSIISEVKIASLHKEIVNIDIPIIGIEFYVYGKINSISYCQDCIGDSKYDPIMNKTHVAVISVIPVSNSIITYETDINNSISLINAYVYNGIDIIPISAVQFNIQK